MQITRSSLDTTAGRNDWFTGTVYIDTIAAPAPSRTGAASVHFAPSGRTTRGTNRFMTHVAISMDDSGTPSPR